MSTMECPVAKAARATPSAVAVATPDGLISYQQFDQRIAEINGRLSYSARARVCFQPEHSVDGLAFFWALFRRNLVACPISNRLSEQQATAVARQVDGKWLSMTTLDTHAAAVRNDGPRELSADKPATIIFSSGSTGTPKAVVHDLRAHMASAAGSNSNIPLTTGDGWLLSLPTYHVGGLSILFRCALAGASVVIPRPENVLADAISNPRVTHVSLVATQLKRLLAGGFVPSLLKAVLLGGSAIPTELVNAAHAADVPLHTTYGLTEMASQVTTTPQAVATEKRATAGTVLPHREVTVDASGEILVRGSTLCLGYWRGGNSNAPIAPVIDSDGWFHTKDRGSMGEDGYLSVMGRIDNMFISGGENIYPEEIENCLLDLPGIRQAIVVALEHAEYGHRPVAIIDADDMRIEVVREALASRLPRFKLPDAVFPWPHEVSQTGIKPRRHDLAAYAKSQYEKGKE